MSDLIDRQAAIDIANGFCHPANIAKELAKLPSAEPERERGKWINHRCDDGLHVGDCSLCGEAMMWFEDDIKPNYCPNCGADMRGKEDG